MGIQNAAGQQVEVVQLEVNEQLGDYGGYSGGAVLDSLGRAALALLVEQKPLRMAVALSERRVASNVLYAVPIDDVITAFGLSVRPAKPIRFDIGLLPPGMVTRPDLIDETVRQVIGARGGDSGAGLVLVRGPGGVGKTVLARQVADDVRVWAEFADGIIMLRVGQAATADSVARQLQEALGYRQRDLADVLAGQRLLLIVDDVWNGELLSTLRVNLPATIAVLATTRGISVAGAAAVKVGPVGRDQAIQILARRTPRNDELDRALGDLADALFGWALLLTLAAAELHRDDELGWGFGDDYDSHPEVTGQSVLIGRAETVRTEFPNDPTMLDDLGRIPETAPPRSIDVLVRRSLDWLDPKQQARFELLAIYPPGAEITQPMLEDLWETLPNVTWKVISLLVRAGLAQPVRRDPPTIELHDLITAWLHHERGGPGDARHQPVHLRLAGLSLLPNDSPGALTKDRAEWLAYHLVAAGAWDRLTALPILRWRSAFLVATGSDAAFLAGLDHYGHTALTQAPEAVYHAVRAWLFAAHVRTLIGRLPISVLVAMALVGDPIAAITQASQHPEAQEAIPAVLAAVADRSDVHLLLDRAAALAGAIPDDRVRSRVLAAIAERLAAVDPPDPALLDRAETLAGAILDDGVRGRVLAAIAERLAAVDPPDPALLDRAETLARSIPDDGVRGPALAAIARRLAAADPARAVALIEQALALAQAIPDDPDRSSALAAIAQRLPAADPRDPALIKRVLPVAQTIPGREWRARALAVIARRLAAADPRDPALIKWALAVARTIPDNPERIKALGTIAEWLAGADSPNLALIEQALAAAGTTPNPECYRALAAIAERLAAVDPSNPALIDQALALAETIPDPEWRARGLAAIAQRLAVIDRARAAALIDQALALVQTIPDRERDKALATIAERLAAADPSNPALIKRARDVARTIPDDWYRSRTLAAIAQRLAVIDPAQAARLTNQALARAQTIPYDGQRSHALATIAEQLAAADPSNPALIKRARDVAQAIPDDWYRSRALAAIAEQLAAADPSNPALIDQALDVAETIPDDLDYSSALAAIAQRLAVGDPSNTVLIGRALTVAETIPEWDWRAMALFAIAEQLVADDSQNLALIDQALAVAQTIPDDRIRSDALARIHALTRSGMLDEMSRWRLRSLATSIDLLTVFLGNCHDKTTAESIGLAVLHVAVEASTEA